MYGESLNTIKLLLRVLVSTNLQITKLFDFLPAYVHIMG